jgi:hypothetical protein
MGGVQDCVDRSLLTLAKLSVLFLISVSGLAVYLHHILIDIRHVLPAIHVPTLVLHRTGDRIAHVAFDIAGLLVLNLTASPGPGKTSLIPTTVDRLPEGVRANSSIQRCAGHHPDRPP